MRYLGALLVFLVLTGCTPSEPAFVELRYRIAGGVAGFDRALLVAASGEYQAFDRERPGAAGQLSEMDRTELLGLIGRVKWPGLADAYTNPRAADAMQESLTVRIGDRSYAVTVGSRGSPPPDLERLLEFLRQMPPR